MSLKLRLDWAGLRVLLLGLGLGFFVLGCWGFAPRKIQKFWKWKSWLRSTWMLNERERSKTERKKWKKKYLPRLFLFWKPPVFEIQNNFWISYFIFFKLFLSFLAGFLGLQFLFPCPTFYSSGAIKVWKSFSVAKGQMQPGFSGWMHLKNGYSLHSSLSSPFWTQKTLLFDCLPHLLLPNKYKKGFPIQTEMGRHPHGHQILPLPHSVALIETPCE